MKSYSNDIIGREEFDNLKNVNARQDKLLKVLLSAVIVDSILVIGTLVYIAFLI